MVLIRSICMVILFVLLVGSVNDGAASSVKITPTTVNGDVYIVSAADVHDASGIDFSFSYDTATIANPKVVPGQFAVDSNALMEANTSTPGFIRVVFLTGGAFKDGGPLATITFTKVGKLPGRVFDLMPAVYSTTTAQVAAQPIIIGTPLQPTEPTTEISPATSPPAAGGGMSNIFTQAQQQQQQASGGSSSGGGMANIYNQTQQQQSGSYLGSVTFSGNSPVQQDPRREEPQRDEPRRVGRGSDAPQEVAPSSTPPAATASASSVQADTVKSPTAKNAKEALALLKAVEMPVQRFQTFKGGRSVKDFVSLFDASAARQAGVVQVPEIAISDGKKMVTVKIELTASGMVPNFSLRGANLKSIRPITDKVWELDALPQKGKFDVHLSVLLGSERVDIPLVVIPPLAAAAIKETQDLSEAGVKALLAKVDSKGKLAYDLNSDGRQDFLDDYILVAHYLLKMQKTDKPAKKIN